MLLAIIFAGAQTEDAFSPENTVILQQIKQRAMAALASVPNYVCVDAIERSVWIPGERQFRHLDRIHLELAHIEGADRFSWLGNSVFELKSPTEMVRIRHQFAGRLRRQPYASLQ
jgi:hypothetical protein